MDLEDEILTHIFGYPVADIVVEHVRQNNSVCLLPFSSPTYRSASESEKTLILKRTF
jgi:hypothetical protein